MTFFDASFGGRVHTLALGVECVDPMLRSRLARAVEIVVEAAFRRDGQAFARVVVPGRLDRHRSGRHALRYAAGSVSHVALRFNDPTRTYVPRRLLIPVEPEPALVDVTETDPVIEAPPSAGAPRWPRGARRVHLFPGAAADLPTGATVLRGRVSRGGAPLPWARVEATTGDGGPAALAHGDDRGEFVLVVPRAVDRTALQPEETWSLRVLPPVADGGAAGAPAVAPLGVGDELFGLPLERVTEAGPEDPVSGGAPTADGWDASAAIERDAVVHPGRTTSRFVIEFS